MKIYLLLTPSILALTGCSTLLQEENSNQVLVAQLCTNNLPDNKVKEIALYPINLIKASKNATEKLNSVILPATPLDMKFVGITPNNMGIYSSVVGYTQSLRYITISEGAEYISFKRDFTQYNQEWSQWEKTDEINVGSMSQTSKVRFKTVVSNGSLEKIRFSNILPDHCN